MADRRRRVLVVDDNRDAARIMSLVLGTLGHEARTARDGEEALAVAESFEPDVALLDLSLPKLDGFEVARRLRAGRRGREVLLIAVTGWAESEHGRAHEFDHYLVKPVKRETLARLIGEGAAVTS